jgi:hypothetical protein
VVQDDEIERKRLTLNLTANAFFSASVDVIDPVVISSDNMNDSKPVRLKHEVEMKVSIQPEEDKRTSALTSWKHSKRAVGRGVRKSKGQLEPRVGVRTLDVDTTHVPRSRVIGCHGCADLLSRTEPAARSDHLDAVRPGEDTRREWSDPACLSRWVESSALTQGA